MSMLRGCASWGTPAHPTIKGFDQMRFIALCLLALAASTAYAGIFGPAAPPFVPTIHADGTRTWVYTVILKQIPKADRALPREERDRKMAGIVIAWSRFCDRWEITDSREDKKQVVIEGRCR